MLEPLSPAQPVAAPPVCVTLALARACALSAAQRMHKAVLFQHVASVAAARLLSHARTAFPVERALPGRSLDQLEPEKVGIV